MRKLSFVLLMCLVFDSALGQTDAFKYQPGTILSVERHQDASSDPAATTARYDVSVRIDDTVYTVLYTPPARSNAVEYSPGIERLFGVGSDKLRYPERVGYTDLPILHAEKLPPETAIDWSKAPGQYFVMKMKNLSASLSLSEEQQAQIKPIAEQESAEATSVIFTPVVSRKERLAQWEKIVRSHDAKMKPILSEAQWQKLREMRTGQKRELKDLIAKYD